MPLAFAQTVDAGFAQLIPTATRSARCPLANVK